MTFFDLTGLPFDPPEKSAKKVKAAIDKKVKELGASLGSETQQVKRDEITAHIKLLNDTGATILTPDGKKGCRKFLLYTGRNSNAGRDCKT
ncbi:MAG: hypothetical protein ACLS3F_04390 [Oscillospiraceae bacterium]